MSDTVRVTRSRSAIRTAPEGTTASLQLSATPAPRQSRRKANVPATIAEDVDLTLPLERATPTSASGISASAESYTSSSSFTRAAGASFATPARTPGSSGRLSSVTPKPVTRLPDSCHSVSEYGNRVLFTPTGRSCDPNKNKLTQTSYTDAQVYGTDACGCKPTQQCEHRTFNAFKDKGESIELSRVTTPRKAAVFHSAAEDDYWTDVYDVFPFVFFSPTLTVGVMKLLRSDPATIAAFQGAVQRSKQRPLCRRAYAYLKYVVLILALLAAHQYYRAHQDKAVLSNGLELTSADVAALLDVYDMSRNPALAKLLAARVDALAGDIRAMIVKGDEQDRVYADSVAKAARTELNKLVEAQVAALRAEQGKIAQEQLRAVKEVDASGKDAMKGLAAGQETLRNAVTTMSKDSAAALDAAQKRLTAAAAEARAAVTGEYTALVQARTREVEKQVEAVAAALKTDHGSLAQRVEVLEQQMKATEAQLGEMGKENKQHTIKVLSATKQVVAEAKKELKAYADAAASKALETAQAAMEAKVNTEVVRALQSTEGILDRVMVQVQEQVTSGEVLAKMIDSIKKQVAAEAQEQAVLKAREAAEALGQAQYERAVAAASKAAREEALQASERAVAEAQATLEKLVSNARTAQELQLKEVQRAYEEKIAALRTSLEAMQAEMKGKFVAAAREGQELDVKQSLVAQVQQAAADAATQAKDAYALAQRALEGMEERVAAAVKEAVATLTQRVSALEGRVDGHDARLERLEEGAERMARLYEELQQGQASASMQEVASAAAKLATRVDTLQSDMKSMSENVVAVQRDAAEAKDAAKHAQDAAANVTTRFASVQSIAEKSAQAVEALKQDVTLLRHQQLQQSAAVEALKATAAQVDVDAKIDRALEIFAADRTGKVDFAAKANGGRVHDHSATHYKTPYNNAVVNFLTTCFQPVQAPDMVIDASSEVGSCWPMDGTQGYVTLRLKFPVEVTQVTLQHVRHSVTATPGTAPRAFRVFGLTAEEAHVHTGAAHPDGLGTFLGAFEYAMDVEHDEQKSVQTFDVVKTGKAFQYIKFQVDSNYGAEDFTCLYRTRVHGKWVKHA